MPIVRLIAMNIEMAGRNPRHGIYFNIDRFREVAADPGPAHLAGRRKEIGFTVGALPATAVTANRRVVPPGGLAVGKRGCTILALPVLDAKLSS